MTSKIHVETPGGEVLKSGPDGGIETPGAQEKGETPGQTADRKDILQGPKSNPDPFANSNLEADQKDNHAEGPGTEITDGEAG